MHLIFSKVDMFLIRPKREAQRRETLIRHMRTTSKYWQHCHIEEDPRKRTKKKERKKRKEKSVV